MHNNSILIHFFIQSIIFNGRITLVRASFNNVKEEDDRRFGREGTGVYDSNNIRVELTALQI